MLGWGNAVADIGLEVAGPGEPLVFGGNSLGALIAAYAAEKIEAYEGKEARRPSLLAISMAPDFDPVVHQALRNPVSELHHPQHNWLLEEAKALRCPELRCPAQLYVSLNETKGAAAAHDYAVSRWANATSYKVPDVLHNIARDPTYIQVVGDNAGRLAVRA